MRPGFRHASVSSHPGQSGRSILCGSRITGTGGYKVSSTGATAMTLNVGDSAPDFEAVNHQGRRVRLSDVWKERPVVLFFYPRAFTPGCTAEACHFRDLNSEFEKLGAKVLGISSDGESRQSEFAGEYGLPFELLSDPDGSIQKLYGVKRRMIPFAKRVTFVIDKGGTIVEVIHDELSMNAHADKALQALERAGGQRGEGGD